MKIRVAKKVVRSDWYRVLHRQATRARAHRRMGQLERRLLAWPPPRAGWVAIEIRVAA